MKRTALLVLLAAGAIAAWSQGKVFVDSVDVAVSNDFPLGVYQDKSKWNLGYSARLNLGFDSQENIRAFFELDNNYWRATPGWISSGTQIDGIVGLGYSIELPSIKGLGTISLGGRVGYGAMVHMVTADTTGTGNASFTFYDQAFLTELEANLDVADGPWGLTLVPRYFYSPESNNQQKQQLGILVGLRLRMQPGSGKGE